jgi:hypothetical protein
MIIALLGYWKSEWKVIEKRLQEEGHRYFERG